MHDAKSFKLPTSQRVAAASPKNRKRPLSRTPELQNSRTPELQNSRTPELQGPEIHNQFAPQTIPDPTSSPKGLKLRIASKDQKRPKFQPQVPAPAYIT
ncbi:hypothetical protein E4U60_006891 [Claviceps pazoutovae]|uniref:Uncharacterized protein n=1 Tax=Claviceps pazoutovae TaxID=1649127 RepID=A0A9P7MFV3_9HYPO|nr:hypothetical protein E4U60_006891 [Claviceps pazoutovae]